MVEFNLCIKNVVKYVSPKTIVGLHVFWFVECTLCMTLLLATQIMAQ